jgi:ribosomal protein S18 acetylase RimI-like enzyme
MQKSYQEVFAEQDFSHLARTVEQYFSKETPLWWVDFLGNRQEEKNNDESIHPSSFILHPSKVACLWVGNAVDQLTNDRHAHIFLLYVKPEHRRRGIGRALMRYVENWAITRGDRQIGLQVFQSNTAAINLYHQLGYQTQSLWMVKPLRSED